MLLMVILSTACEVYLKQFHDSKSFSSRHPILTSFSIISNTRKLSQGDDRFDSLNCMKMLMTIHVVIFHSYLLYWSTPLAKRYFSGGIYKFFVHRKYFFIRSAAFTMDSYMLSM